MDERLGLRLELEELYAAYAGALDDGDYLAWPEFFTDECSYKVISSENHGQGLPLAAILCESKGMLLDRVHAIMETSMYEPRIMRHMVSGIRVLEAAADRVSARANFCILETLNDEPTQVFLSGEYRDELVRVGGQLRFRERLCIFDTNLVRNSIIVPV